MRCTAWSMALTISFGCAELPTKAIAGLQEAGHVPRRRMRYVAASVLEGWAANASDIPRRRVAGQTGVCDTRDKERCQDVTARIGGDWSEWCISGERHDYECDDSQALHCCCKTFCDAKCFGADVDCNEEGKGWLFVIFITLGMVTCLCVSAAVTATIAISVCTRVQSEQDETRQRRREREEEEQAKQKRHSHPQSQRAVSTRASMRRTMDSIQSPMSLSELVSRTSSRSASRDARQTDSGATTPRDSPVSGGRSSSAGLGRSPSSLSDMLQLLPYDLDFGGPRSPSMVLPESFQPRPSGIGKARSSVAAAPPLMGRGSSPTAPQTHPSQQPLPTASQNSRSGLAPAQRVHRRPPPGSASSRLQLLGQGSTLRPKSVDSAAEGLAEPDSALAPQKPDPGPATDKSPVSPPEAAEATRQGEQGADMTCQLGLASAPTARYSMIPLEKETDSAPSVQNSPGGGTIQVWALIGSDSDTLQPSQNLQQAVHETSSPGARLPIPKRSLRGAGHRNRPSRSPTASDSLPSRSQPRAASDERGKRWTAENTSGREVTRRGGGPLKQSGSPRPIKTRTGEAADSVSTCISDQPPSAAAVHGIAHAPMPQPGRIPPRSKKVCQSHVRNDSSTPSSPSGMRSSAPSTPNGRTKRKAAKRRAASSRGASSASEPPSGTSDFADSASSLGVASRSSWRVPQPLAERSSPGRGSRDSRIRAHRPGKSSSATPSVSSSIPDEKSLSV